MTDDELVAFAADFRAGILDGRSVEGFCAMICWPLASLLNWCGIEAEVVEVDVEGDFDGNHIWIRLGDGRALDPTADQFNDYGFGPFPEVYLGPVTNIHGLPFEPLADPETA